MTVRFVRPVSHAASLSRFFGMVAFLLFAVAAPLHRFGPMTTPDFVAAVLISAAIAALATCLALIGLLKLWQVGALGGVSSLKALLYSALPLGVVLWGGFLYWQNPKIYDVSTDLADVPAWLSPPAANQQWLPRPANMSPTERSEQLAAYPGLIGRRYEGAVDRVYEAARRVAAQQGIRIVKVEGVNGAETDVKPAVPKQDEEPEELSPDELPTNVPVPLARPRDAPTAVYFADSGIINLQGETRSFIWGFRFDVVIRLREETETTVVDARVASRFGPHDLGLSAKITEAYLQALDIELLGISGD